MKIGMNSHEFSSNTLQGKDVSSDFGDVGPVEKKTSNKKELLLQNKTADISVNNDFQAKPSVKTVQRYLDAHEDKEKIKLSDDQILPKDTHASEVLKELSQDYLSMTDDVKLVHIKDAGLHVNAKHMDKSAVEAIQPAKATIEDVAELSQSSSEVKDEEDSAETEQKMQSDILLSVLARAQRTKPPVLQKSTAQEPKRENGDDTVPTIVIIPSESPAPTELIGKWLSDLIL